MAHAAPFPSGGAQVPGLIITDLPTYSGDGADRDTRENLLKKQNINQLISATYNKIVACPFYVGVFLLFFPYVFNPSSLRSCSLYCLIDW